MQQGGVLTIADSGTLGAGTVTGGAAGNGTTAGAGLGTGLFLQGDQTVTLAPGAGLTQTVAGTIADETGATLATGQGTGTGAGSLAIGPGTVVLSGANTFTGGTAIGDGGTLDLANATAAGTGAISGDGAVMVDADVTLADANSYAGGTTIDTGFTLTANHANTSVYRGDAIGTGTVTFNGGTLALGANTYTFGNALAVGAAGGAIDATAAGFVISNAGLSGTGALSISATTAVNNGQMGFDLDASSAGFTGPLTIAAGNVFVTAQNALPSSSDVTVASGATLDIVNTQAAGSLAGAGTVTARDSSPGNTSPATLTTGGDNATTAFTGTIQDGTSTLTLVKAGTGTFTLSAADTYTGGTTISGGTLDLAQATSAGTGAIAYMATSGTATATLALESAAQPAPGMALGAAGATFGNTLANFNAMGETLDLRGFAFSGQIAYTTNGTTLTVTGGNGGAQTETFALTNGAQVYTAQSDNNGGTLVTAVCYVGGTRIRVLRDGAEADVAVEHLVVGDLAVTASGAHRPIRWIGSRLTHPRRHPRPHEAMPVRVAAHAFAPNRPARDLLVSPGHSLCVNIVGEVLIPAMALINGRTIIQEDVDSVTYWHVELEDGHDILLAENMPAESYLDMGNRGFFAESGVVDLDASPDAPVATHADFCHPFHMEGPLVEVVRAQLAARATRLGWRLEEQGLGDLHLLVDGVRIEPRVRGLAVRFTVPAGAEAVWLVSGTAVPAEIAASTDRRSLGVCVRALTIDDGFGAPVVVTMDDPQLCVGFHAVERDGDSAWRWTAGRARLPASLWEGLDGDTFLRVDLAGPALPRWVAPADGGEIPVFVVAGRAA